MKSLSLVFGALLVIGAWALLQIGKGVTFTYGEYEEWNKAFLEDYYACCLMTDLQTVAPIALLGIVLLLFSAWRFTRR
ncbi:hypothetical protein ROA7450_03302 [Roseovarius albus]|uniref:Uncharacterized protein n=1 Tax=Roseovarius albus TaxID=1247867 RepID=A0A1X6ZVT4_9RHOB|nr:hypothetical protein [Roseovarius albus]SLN63177.1 hypothetical protein ROA7450_03302 [Roseovarius albus]